MKQMGSWKKTNEKTVALKGKAVMFWCSFLKQDTIPRVVLCKKLNRYVQCYCGLCDEKNILTFYLNNRLKIVSVEQHAKI